MNFGIDLGTTYSSVGYYDPDAREVKVAQLESAAMNWLLPSAVFIESPENVLVGVPAIHAGLVKPERMSRWFKRSMGQSADTAPLIDGKRWTPVDCSAKILETLKNEGAAYFGMPISDVVITFPAWFTPQQKDLTRDAAIQAGLNVINMIEEPSAAALAYVIDKVMQRLKEASQVPGNMENLESLVPKIVEELAGKDRAVLVYDLGGGTFDVALVQAKGTPTPEGDTELAFRVLCNDGNIFLGGRNWDEDIRTLVAQIDQEKYEHNPFDDPQSGRLDDDCERAKKELSKQVSTIVLCTKLHQIEVTRDTVAERTAIHLKKTRQTIESVINKAVEGIEVKGEKEQIKIKKENITLLVAGGMTRWPPVEKMLMEVMDGRKPTSHKNVDLMVTYGAAYLAHLTTIRRPGPPGPDGAPTPGEPEPVQPRISIPGTDGAIVVPTDEPVVEIAYPAIGIEVLDRNDPLQTKTVADCIIGSGAKAGDEPVTKTYATVHDNQEEVEIVLRFLKDREGHKDTEMGLDAWKEYKRFRLTGLPRRPRGQRINVRLGYSAGGVIDGVAWDDTGHEVKITGETRQG